MGKKSRRKRDKEHQTVCRTNQTSIVTSETEFRPSFKIVSYLSESEFENPFDDPTPKHGWARELREAERELRRATNPDAILRAARAARAMRQFDRLAKILKKADNVTIDGADKQALLRAWRDECTAYKNRRSRVDEPQIKDLLSAVRNGRTNVDTVHIEHEQSYLNENAIQYAAAMGDVPFLERLVALGAALDFADAIPITSIKTRDIKDEMKVKKPPGSTALLLAVLQALSARQCLAFGGEDATMRDMYEGEIECAIQLVRLGANVDVRLEIPSGRDGKSKTYMMKRMMGWAGKSVRELAHETGSDLLVKTIELFDSENKIQLVNCRCGSRLPWAKCHAGMESERFCLKKQDGIKLSDSNMNIPEIWWKRSPLSPCPCQNTTSVYFRCCWNESVYREYFQNDETGGCHACYITSEDQFAEIEENQCCKDAIVNMYQISENAADADAFLAELAEKSQTEHPKSKIGTWDKQVYAGVKELIGNSFSWSDIHWIVPKPELLKRVHEWNQALEQYCDDEGLVGLKREQVVKLHTASPFAPCANMKCTKVETRVKEFSRCSRCLSVAYCSESCLREDYPFHKKTCTKRY